MGKQSSAPAAPDPKELARLQGIEDRKTMRANLDATRTSTVNPFGTTGWTNKPTFDQAGYDAAVAAAGGSGAANGALLGAAASSPVSRDDYMHDSWTNTQTLSPESQGIYDTATSKLGDATKNISTDVGAYNQSVADAVQRRMTRYLAPQQAAERNAMQTNLADRGFQVGNAGYNDEMTRMDTNQSTANADIADRAQITGATQGLQEQSMQQQIAQALSSLRNQQVAGVSGMATTTSAPTMQPFDVAGTTMQQWQAQVDAANASNASANGFLGGALQLGATALAGPLGGIAAGSLLPKVTDTGSSAYGAPGMGGGTGLKIKGFYG